MRESPRSLKALIDRFLADVRRHDWRAASLMAAIHEPYRDRDKYPDPFTANDYLSGGADAEDEDDGEPDPEALEEFKRRMMKSLGIAS